MPAAKLPAASGRGVCVLQALGFRPEPFFLRGEGSVAVRRDRDKISCGARALGALPEGGLAQLARAPALQAGGQRFESVILHAKDIDMMETKERAR